MADFPTGYADPRPVGGDELGMTFQARDPASGGEVAVRVLDLTIPGRSEQRRFRGACSGTALNAIPGVLRCHEIGFTEGHHPFLVTDPATVMAGPLAVAPALTTGIALARTLAAAHAAGVLHQDVRPANVVATAAEPTLLANFGVTRAAVAAGLADLPPVALAHAAREIFGWEIPGPAADVHGLASTIFAMLTGQAPYAAEAAISRAALYQRVLRGDPPPVPGAPAGLSSLLAAMMAPDPPARPALDEVIDRLSDLAAGLAAGLGEPSPASVPAPGLFAAVAAQSAAPSATVTPPATPPPSAPLTTPPPSAPLTTPPPSAPRTARQGRRGYAGLLLLIGAGVVALLAGLVWGVVTAPSPQPSHSASPIVTPTATSSAVAMPLAEQTRYRPNQVRLAALSAGTRVSWSAPSVTSGLTAFIVVAETGGQTSQARTVGPATHSVTFTGLPPGQRYCFVVGALVETSGPAATAAAAPVCITIS